jgi:alanine racemase
LPEQTEQILELYKKQDNVQLTGMFTHFHSAFDPEITQAQFDAFTGTADAVRHAGYEPGMLHCCNSTAFLKYPQMHLDGVRLGSALLGRLPIDSVGLERVGYCVASLDAVRTIPAGHSVGYGAAWRAKRETRIAVIPVGYINGFSVERGYDTWRFLDCLRGIARQIKAILTRKALHVQVNGKMCRVLGHVGMVNLVIDVTDVPCQVGDLARIEINPLLVRGMEIQYTKG